MIRRAREFRVLGAILGAVLTGMASAVPDPAASESLSGQSGTVPATVLHEVFPDGLPYPFENVLARLRATAGQTSVTTALIPLGRSLQRFAAAPDYFASPRLIVAVTGDGAAGPDEPHLAGRLYLGFQPAARAIEAIAYSEDAGRFEFFDVVGYGDQSGWTIEPADRASCLQCHQGEGPIFARPLWSESNANPGIAGRLDVPHAGYHGAPARQSVDALGAFDQATDRAAEIAVANRLWAEGCAIAACRAALLVRALRHGLRGAGENNAENDLGFAERAGTLWPDGLAVISPDLPNRDPASLLASLSPDEIVEPTGVMNPESERRSLVVWRPGPGGFDDAARLVAAQLTPGDYRWIDAKLSAITGPGETISLPCATVDATLPGKGTEVRFACENASTYLAGFWQADGPGRIDELSIGGNRAAGPVKINALADGDGIRLVFTALAPRLPDGRRLDAPVFSNDRIVFRIIDDLSVLAPALDVRAGEGMPALGSGPFRRRAVLALIADVLSDKKRMRL